MEEEYNRSRRSRDKHRRHRHRHAEDEIYYRDTEETSAYEPKYAEEQINQFDIDDDETRLTPEGTANHNSRRSKQRDEKEGHKSKDRKRSVERSERKAVHYKEEREHHHDGKKKEHREKSKERSRTKKRDKERHEQEVEYEQEDEPECSRKTKDSKKERVREHRRRDISDEEKEEREEEITEKSHRGRTAERLKRSKKEIPENLQREDSIEKTRRERSKENSRRRKSKDRLQKNYERNDGDEVYSKKEEKRRKRSSRSKQKDKLEDQNISFAAPSETYEEMKKTSHTVRKHHKRKEKHAKEEEEEVESENQLPSHQEVANNKRCEKERRKTRTHESHIKKEIRKKREPRHYHSDSEVEINKIPKTKKHALKEHQHQENLTSSISSVEKPLDIDSLYSLYKDPDPKPVTKQVIIKASSKENTETAEPKKISIDQTNIRSKLIRVLFQRVKELLTETEALRNERKTLTLTIDHLNKEVKCLREKNETRVTKEQKLEDRLEILADEMKITAKGTSFREEIHQILHTIQNKYQIHWKEHESKIKQVQNDAEDNIQSLMKNIVGKYVELSELKGRSNEVSEVKNERVSTNDLVELNGRTNELTELHNRNNKASERAIQLTELRRRNNLPTSGRSASPPDHNIGTKIQQNDISVHNLNNDKDNRENIMLNLISKSQQQQQPSCYDNDKLISKLKTGKHDDKRENTFITNKYKALDGGEHRKISFGSDKEYSELSYRSLVHEQPTEKPSLSNQQKMISKKDENYVDNQEFQNRNYIAEPVISDGQYIERYMREESNRILRNHPTVTDENFFNYKQQKKRLNEPLFIDTKTHPGNMQDKFRSDEEKYYDDGIRSYNEEQTRNMKNENLLLQVVPQALHKSANENTNSDRSSMYSKCIYSGNRESFETSSSAQSLNSDTKTSSTTNDQKQSQRAIYYDDVTKTSRQDERVLMNDEGINKPDEYRPLSLKMDAKEFWRHKLLQPTLTNESNRRNECDYNNPTVRNTF